MTLSMYLLDGYKQKAGFGLQGVKSFAGTLDGTDGHYDRGEKHI